MELKVTSRGFQYLEFLDLYGAKCSLQQSSLATEEALWFGPDSADPKIMASKTKAGGNGWVPFEISSDVSLTTRAHLSRDMVVNLVASLEGWLNSGKIEPPNSEEQSNPKNSAEMSAALRGVQQTHDAIALLKDLADRKPAQVLQWVFDNKSKINVVLAQQHHA